MLYFAAYSRRKKNTHIESVINNDTLTDTTLTAAAWHLRLDYWRKIRKFPAGKPVIIHHEYGHRWAEQVRHLDSCWWRGRGKKDSSVLPFAVMASRSVRRRRNYYHYYYDRSVAIGRVPCTMSLATLIARDDWFTDLVYPSWPSCIFACVLSASPVNGIIIDK